MALSSVSASGVPVGDSFVLDSSVVWSLFPGFGFRFSGFRFRVSGIGKLSGFGFQELGGFESRVSGIRFRV